LPRKLQTNIYKNKVSLFWEFCSVAVGCVSNNSEEFSTSVVANCFKALAKQPTITWFRNSKTGSIVIMNHHDGLKSVISQ
jgi:hypothetical protein